MNRKLLKDNAKIALKQNFWLVMLVVLVAQFLGVTDVGGYSGGGSVGGSSSYEDNDWDFDNSDDDDDISFNDNDLQQMSYGDFSAQPMQMSAEEGVLAAITALSVGVIIVIVVGVLVVAWVISIFLTNPVQVGYRRFFMMNRMNKGKFVDLFSSFCPQYINIVKGMFTTNLIIFGWTLLFIIPGIIKAYQYFFVPFILSENPDISGARAREISTQMTDGHKFDIFVLGLSFLGWNLLAAVIAIPAALLTCCLMGVGAYLVYTPLGGYMGATYAELYEERREYAIYNHLVSNEELCGFDVQAES